MLHNSSKFLLYYLLHPLCSSPEFVGHSALPRHVVCLAKWCNSAGVQMVYFHTNTLRVMRSTHSAAAKFFVPSPQLTLWCFSKSLMRFCVKEKIRKRRDEKLNIHWFCNLMLQKVLSSFETMRNLIELQSTKLNTDSGKRCLDFSLQTSILKTKQKNVLIDTYIHVYGLT